MKWRIDVQGGRQCLAPRALSTPSVKGRSPIHLDLDPVRIDRDVPADHCENLRAQDCDQIGMAAHVAFVFKQNLQPLARHRRGADWPKKTEQFHAALLRHILVNNPSLWVGIVISTAAPASRRAAPK